MGYIMASVNAQKQQELFEEFVIREKRKSKLFGAFKFKKPIFPQQRLTLSFSYEILIIGLIGVVLSASILFSLGVERGRSLEFTSAVYSPGAVQPAAKITAGGIKISPSNVVAEQPAEVREEATDKPEKGQEAINTAFPETRAASRKNDVKASPLATADKPFTIQVASYKTRDPAEKELTRLKNKGYSSNILKKGNYFILCVGSYAEKELAKQALPVWERQYKGCIVRKR
jgi:cell division septation protein DedD